MPEPEASPLPTRERILKEASLLFADRGYHNTTTRDIATAVGIRQPSLFHHFETKDAIMAELQRLDFECPLALAPALKATDASAAAKVYRFLYVDLFRCLASPYDFSSAHAPWILRDPVFASANKSWQEVMSQHAWFIGQAVASGEFIEVEVSQVSRAIDWMFDGALLDGRGNRPRPGEQSELMASFAVRALLVDQKRLGAVRAEADRLPGEEWLATEG